MSVERANEFAAAVRAIKRGVSILVSLNSGSAAAAITVKMIDAWESLIKSDVDKSLSDLWSCAFAIQRVLYNAMSERFDKKSEHAVAAECLASDCKYRDAYKQYSIGNSEISAGTGMEVLFLECKDESI